MVFLFYCKSCNGNLETVGCMKPQWRENSCNLQFVVTLLWNLLSSIYKICIPRNSHTFQDLAYQVVILGSSLWFNHAYLFPDQYVLFYLSHFHLSESIISSVHGSLCFKYSLSASGTIFTNLKSAPLLMKHKFFFWGWRLFQKVSYTLNINIMKKKNRFWL